MVELQKLKEGFELSDFQLKPAVAANRDRLGGLGLEIDSRSLYFWDNDTEGWTMIEGIEKKRVLYMASCNTAIDLVVEGYARILGRSESKEFFKSAADTTKEYFEEIYIVMVHEY